MEKIKGYFGKPWVIAAVSFVLGLIIGLPILGWGLMPVQWVDAGPKDLRFDAKVDYLLMAVETFARDQDAVAAQTRWKELMPDNVSPAVQDEAMQAVEVLRTDPKYSMYAQDLTAFGAVVGVPILPGAILPTPGAKGESTQPAKTEKVAKPTETVEAGQPTVTISPLNLLATASSAQTPASPTSTTKMTSLLVPILAVLCLSTLVVGGFLVYYVFLRKKPGRLPSRPTNSQQEATPGAEGETEAQSVEVPGEGGSAAISQFMTTYNLNDDLYDDSFSIDTPAGEFLGECGVGISETIGVGDPKKVTAFEVWLFDKNDIQTVTKVLMSEHAFNDPQLRQRLQSKGEPVLVGVGTHIILETATLQLQARVHDMSYGSGALPAGSYFERLTLDLQVFPKEK
jgi:hypothetical protein